MHNSWLKKGGMFYVKGDPGQRGTVTVIKRDGTPMAATLNAEIEPGLYTITGRRKYAPRAEANPPNPFAARQETQEEVTAEGPGITSDDAVEEATEATEAMSSSQDPLSRMIAKAVAPFIKASVDAETVKAIVDVRVAKAIEAAKLPQTITHQHVITITRADESKVTIEGVHPLFPRLLTYLNAGLHVYLHGAPGGGKSTAGLKSAEVTKHLHGYIATMPQTPESRIIGYMDANRMYHRTSFRDCFEHGGWFTWDEMDNASDGMLTVVNGALANGSYAFPDGIVARHPEFRVIATGNTAGRGGTINHAGRRPFDAATADRFTYIHWTYDEGFEDRLVMAINPEAMVWAKWVRTVRAYVAVHHPRVIASPRSALDAARLLKVGAVESAEQLAEDTLFKGLEASIVDQIKRNCPLPTIKRS